MTGIEHLSHKRQLAAIAAIVLVGVSLRSPITSLAAVLGEVQADLDLGPTLAGLLTSLPVLCFAVGAAVVTGVARRVGINAVMIVSMALLAFFVVARPFAGPMWFLVATAGIGLAITAGNVLLPVVVRRDFPSRQGAVLATSTASITGGAALAAALTVPLALWLGWRWAIALWAVIMVAGAVIYKLFAGPDIPEPARAATRVPVWRLPAAWAMAVFFGMQSGMFYAVTSWLPTFLPELTGASDAQATVAATLFQLLGIVGALSTPVLMTKVYNRRALSLVITGMWAAFPLSLLVAPQLFLIAVIPAGIAQGACFGMLLSLYTLRANDLSMVRDISGMTQTVGYVISALAPVSVGALFEATGSWRVGILLLLTMGVVLISLAPVVSSRKKLGLP